MISLVSAFAASVTIVAALVPPINMPLHAEGDQPPFPAPAGYVLPWAGGEIHTVTQGEETTFTHNGLAAYAFDFDLNYDTIVATRGGKVTFVRDDSNLGGCSPLFSASANYIVIDHGDGTSGLYLHIAQGSVTLKPGDLVDQGQPIAIAGETGFTCADDDHNPGPHLHFQVERTEEGRYFTQSLPIAFDDIAKNDGVPTQDQSYVSGNYGRGKPQKIKLTPHRVERIYNPTAVPENPDIIEAVPGALPTPEASPTPPADTAPAVDLPVATETAIEIPTDTPDETDTPRPTRTPSDTPTPEPPAATETRSLPTATPSPAAPPPSVTPPAVGSPQTLGTALPIATETPAPATSSPTALAIATATP